MGKREKRQRSRGSAGNNRKTGEDFLEKNGKKEGVVQLESGLQYKVIEEGDGDRPDAMANITVHQRCQLVNGTIIEDTYRENEPSEVQMQELIEGYQEGILLMKKMHDINFLSQVNWHGDKKARVQKYHQTLF